MDLNIIKSFCRNRDSKLLHNLSPIARDLLVDGCFTVLFQKYGDQELAALALEELGEIKKLRFKSNEAEGKAKYKKKNKLVDWKKLSDKEQLDYRPWISAFMYTGSQNLTGYQSLKRMGAVVMKVIDKKDLPAARSSFIQATRTFPEYKRDPNDPDRTVDGHPLLYVLGGFAAFGNPSSFHNTYVRNMRKSMRKVVLPLFNDVINRMYNEKQRENTKLEMLFDRMMYRHISQAPLKESWHRDVTPSKYLRKGDEVYGGWLNLDLTQNQYLSFLPGSHLGVDLLQLREGFASLSPEAIRVVNPYKSKFTVPPGHILIFPQYILHEVISTKAKYNMMRIFNGWRTTTSKNFLFSSIPKLTLTQGIIPLPSGQKPPMYSRLGHGLFYKFKPFRPIKRLNNWKVSTIGWSTETFKEAGTRASILLSYPKKGDKPSYRLVSRHMSSLQHYGLPMYPPYTKEEMNLYRPSLIS